MKKISLIILILFTSLQLSAQDKKVTGTTSGDDFEKVGSAGAQFLKIGVGARGSAMGGAFSSLANDLSALYWNPAGVAHLEDISAYFSYTQWFAGYSHNFGALMMPINDDFKASIFAINFASPRIEETTVTETDGTGSLYSVNDLTFGATLSGYLTDQFSFGFTAKLIRNSFSTVNASGVAFDIGTQYDTGIYGLKFGFAIHNLGSEQTYVGNDLNRQSNNLKGSSSIGDAFGGSGYDIAIPAYPFSLPLIFRAGASSHFLDTDDHDVIVSADFITMSDTPEQFAAGVEYTFKDFLSIRGGYYYGNDLVSLSGGIGMNYTSGLFDGIIEYSANPTENFGLINRLNVILNFKD